MNVVLFCAGDAGIFERLGEVPDEGTDRDALRFPFLSSLNHILKVCRMLLRFRTAPGCLSSPIFAPLPEAGVLDGVGATSKVELRATGMIQGEAPPRSVAAVLSCSGVAGIVIGGASLTGLKGGDFVNRAWPPPECPPLDSVDEDVRSFSLSSFSFTASFDFFLTSPAASSADAAI